jgi:hypothetical protein
MTEAGLRSHLRNHEVVAGIGGGAPAATGAAQPSSSPSNVVVGAVAGPTSISIKQRRRCRNKGEPREHRTRCDVCSASLLKKNLGRHMREVHNDVGNNNPPSTTRDVVEATISTSLACEPCARTFPNRGAWTNHRRSSKCPLSFRRSSAQ